MSLDDGICPICNQPMDAYYSAFQNTPFIDGKKYDGICQTCAELPVWGEYRGDELVFYEASDPHLRTVEEMVGVGGFDKKEVEFRLKILKSLIKKRLHVVPVMVKWPVIKDDDVLPPKKYKADVPPKKKYKKA